MLKKILYLGTQQRIKNKTDNHDSKKFYISRFLLIRCCVENASPGGTCEGSDFFTTKYGCVETCARMLQAKLRGETTIANLKREPIPNIQDFDSIILGGSIYVGKIQSDEHIAKLTAAINQH